MKYVVRKPNNTRESPIWVEGMDRYHGQELELVPETGDLLCYGGALLFNVKWCTPSTRYYFKKLYESL